MLRNTFLHLPGVGPHREQALWERGILDWDGFLAAAEAGLLPERVYRQGASVLRQCKTAADETNVDFFRRMLPQREMWRLCPEFAGRALFLDIETTGLSSWGDAVTVIGGFGGGELSLFVRGVNLEQFPAYVRQFPLLVSFNGSQFDVPFLQAHFPGARLDQAHVDLRFVLASLGYRGGLKAVERTLGIGREPSIRGVDGFEAVRLWRRHERGDRAALEKLLLYNLTDVVNLVELLEMAIVEKCRMAAFPGGLPGAAFSLPKFDARRLAGWIAGRIE
jgi:hypothetical protein